MSLRLSPILGLLIALGLSPSAQAQDEPAEAAPPQPVRVAPGAAEPQPFGANLFTGSYAGQREDGINPEYLILPGDRVRVTAWGTVAFDEVFVVDSQGNLFLPTVGPVPVLGIRNGDLTGVVRGAMLRTYRGTFEVYTNLLTASPVAVFVTGGVTRPGRYAGIASDSPLVFLDQAGGIDRERGSFRRISVIRQGEEIADIDLYDFLLRGRLPAVQLQDGDVILVERRGPVIEVRPSSGPPILVELLATPTSGAELLEVVSPSPRVDSVTIRGVRDGRPTARTFAVASFAGIEVRSGDIVVFRQDLQPDHLLVRIEGEFMGSAELAVRRGTRLLDLLNHISVDPELAYAGAVYLRRRSVAAQQRTSLHESLDRLERAVMIAESRTQGESVIRRQEAEMVRDWARSARDVAPLGVVVTATGGEQVNLLLEDGDILVIPRRTNVIRVVGEVTISHAVMYRPDLRVQDYVRMAGGYTARADEGHVIVRRANAEIVFGGNDTLILPGDEVIIPPSIEDKWLQNGIELANVFYQLAVSAAIIMRPF